MLVRVTAILLVVSLVIVVTGVFGSVIIGSLISPGLISMATRLDYFLNEYAWVLRLWRYTLYACAFLFWPALGRKARARDLRDWTDVDVQDWNGYRYRLVVILIAIDIAIIDQWLFRFIGVTS